MDSKARVTRGSSVPWLAGFWERKTEGLCLRCTAGGHRRRLGGRPSQSRGGEGRREKAGRPARVPGLVTAGGPGNPRPHTLAEMAGGEDRRVVGTLHLLLLLATVLSLTAGNLSLVSAAWTREKVRGRCCFPYLSGCWRVPGPGTPPPPPSPGLAGGGARIRDAVPLPRHQVLPNSWETSAVSPKSGRQGWSPGCSRVA